MGDAAAYLRGTLREREAELTRTIQLVADLKATVIELADALEQCTHRSAELRAALTTEQQAREHDAVAADNTIDRLTKAIHAALAHGDRTTLGTVREGLADAVNNV